MPSRRRATWLIGTAAVLLAGVGLAISLNQWGGPHRASASSSHLAATKLTAASLTGHGRGARTSAGFVNRDLGSSSDLRPGPTPGALADTVATLMRDLTDRVVARATRRARSRPTIRRLAPRKRATPPRSTSSTVSAGTPASSRTSQAQFVTTQTTVTTGAADDAAPPSSSPSQETASTPTTSSAPADGAGSGTSSSVASGSPASSHANSSPSASMASGPIGYGSAVGSNCNPKCS